MILNTKTYSWSGFTQGVSSWIERSLGIAALFSAVTASLRIDNMARLTWKLNVPVANDSESGCCPTDPILGFSEAVINIRISPSLNSAQRADFLLRLQNLVSTAEFTAAVTNLVTPTS